MHTTLLREFADLVPTCTQFTSLSHLFTLFKERNCERIVLVDEQQYPLGLLSLHRLLPYLETSLEQDTSPSSLAAPLPLQTALLETQLNLVDPLPVLQADLSLEEFWLHLQQWSSNCLYLALVNSENQFLGLLDSNRLLKFITLRIPTQAFQQSIGLPSHPGHSLNPSTGFDRIQLWMQLLEQLPFPTMLQTSTGQILLQNASWRQQLSALKNPEDIQQAAALLLESMLSSSGTLNPESLMAGLPTPIPVDTCELGSEPNTCICICPLKSGSHQIWAFTKIPLNLSLYPGSLESGSSASTLPQESLKDFRLGTLNSNYSPIHPQETEGEPLWLIIAHSETEQDPSHRELIAKNADLIQLNRMKDEFLSCISHELRTPLTAVLGLSSLLRENVLGELNDRQSRYVHLIYQSGRHLMAIVNDILDLTRMETGQLDLSLDTVDLVGLCQSAIQIVQSNYSREHNNIGLNFSSEFRTDEKNSHTTTLTIEPGLVSVVADEARLRQMLVNLLGNALKFTDQGGAIGLRVSTWENWIAFTIWDTGIGIPEDKQHLIFQKFQQLENPLTRRFEGTGLGLVLSQRLARLHGGEISFISQEGKGSEFTLLLPNCPADDASMSPEEASLRYRSANSPPETNHLVLVVETTTQIIDEFNRWMADWGYRVVIARSGPEALEKVRQLHPCLVFLKPALPLLSGWDVFTLLRSRSETCDIPIVFTIATEPERIQAQQLSPEAFLSLPIQPPNLKQILARFSPIVVNSPEPPPRLTILLLKAVYDSETFSPPTDPPTANIRSIADGAHFPQLSTLLQAYSHRILEVDDLEQAELITRVWQPDVVVLDGPLLDPLSYFQKFSQQPALSQLPLITLTEATTQIANQIPGLSVFPCLIPHPSEPGHPSEVSTLVEVIQVATGLKRNSFSLG